MLLSEARPRPWREKDNAAFDELKKDAQFTLDYKKNGMYGRYIHKLLGMKAPYESPRFKYLKKYVKPESIEPAPNDPKNYELYDKFYDELDKAAEESVVKCYNVNTMLVN